MPAAVYSAPPSSGSLRVVHLRDRAAFLDEPFACDQCQLMRSQAYRATYAARFCALRFSTRPSVILTTSLSREELSDGMLGVDIKRGDDKAVPESGVLASGDSSELDSRFQLLCIICVGLSILLDNGSVLASRWMFSSNSGGQVGQKTSA